MFTASNTNNKYIDIIEPIGDLTGSYARDLQEFLCNCIDKRKCFLLINLKRTSNIDSLSIKFLCDFIKRGGQTRLFNVAPPIKWIIKMEEKDDLIKAYDESDRDKAASMFGKEISNKEHKIKSELKTRNHVRVATDFHTEFIYEPDNNGLILGRTKVVNLSEGGMLADQIMLICAENGEITDSTVLDGKELNEIKFKLEENADHILTNGHCVRVNEDSDRFSAGVQFKDLNRNYKNKIRDFVFENYGKC